jgi:hypothetical protein
MASADLHNQGRVCFPTWPDETLTAFLRYQGAGLVVSNVMRMNHSWPRCPDNSSRDYCYGSCSTAHEYSEWSDTYMRRLVGSLTRIGYGGAKLLYLHPFISTETGAPTKYADDRQLEADGTQECDYHGEYVGTLHNKYGRQLLEFVSLAMDTYGFDGANQLFPLYAFYCACTACTRTMIVRQQADGSATAHP